MNKNVPNKTIRTIILVVIIMVYLGATIYVAITKEKNNLAGSGVYKLHNYYEYDYDDYDYDEDYDDDYYDDDYYDEDYDDDYYNDDKEVELELDSYTVTYIYDYIKDYSSIPGLKENFTTSTLTQEEKMQLVVTSLYSKKKALSNPLTDTTELELILNNRTYKATTPNERFATYEVTNMYEDLFGSSKDMNKTTLMYYGHDVVFKYQENSYGYVKYTATDQTPLNTVPSSKLIKATKKGKTFELYVSVGNLTEKYTFEETTTYTYTLIGRTTTKEKNSV